MTQYERLRVAAEPFLPVIYRHARQDMKQLVALSAPGHRTSVLDVGGRKSPYTVGLDADITILDLPRESEVQQDLGLGVNDELLRELSARRSNITAVVIQDMIHCDLPSDSYDGVVCVEVIEHVAEADAFMAQVARVIKPGGWFYATTPNYDYLTNEGASHNPDHVSLYTRQSLLDLLQRHFSTSQVVWGVHTGPNRVRGLRSFSWRRPLQTGSAMIANVVNHLESRGLDQQSQQTAHLFATAFK
jgi:SAM-dependent methyltransferase